MLKWSWYSSQLFSKILWSTLKIRQGQAVSGENNVQPHQKAQVTVSFVHKNNCTSLYLVPQKTYCNLHFKQNQKWKRPAELGHLTEQACS